MKQQIQESQVIAIQEYLEHLGYLFRLEGDTLAHDAHIFCIKNAKTFIEPKILRFSFDNLAESLGDIQLGLDHIYYLHQIISGMPKCELRNSLEGEFKKWHESIVASNQILKLKNDSWEFQFNWDNIPHREVFSDLKQKLGYSNYLNFLIDCAAGTFQEKIRVMFPRFPENSLRVIGRNCKKVFGVNPLIENSESEIAGAFVKLFTKHQFQIGLDVIKEVEPFNYGSTLEAEEIMRIVFGFHQVILSASFSEESKKFMITFFEKCIKLHENLEISK